MVRHHMCLVIVISILLCDPVIYKTYVRFLLIYNSSVEPRRKCKTICNCSRANYDYKGYGSNVNTLKHTSDIHTSITMYGINKFMNIVSFRNKTRDTNYKAFVVNVPRDEYVV